MLNASRRFRYTLDLKKEEEKKQIIAKIRTHAHVIRVLYIHFFTPNLYIDKLSDVYAALLAFQAAYLFQAAGQKEKGMHLCEACQLFLVSNHYCAFIVLVICDFLSIFICENHGCQ